MVISATQKNTRQTPRKVRLVANQVKGMSIEKAISQLAVIERRATSVLLKVVQQAVSNAVNNHGIALEDLSLKNIMVNEGPRYKRFQAVSRGRAHSIIKRTSHITVQLEVREIGKEQPVSKAKNTTKTEETQKKAEETPKKTEEAAKKVTATTKSQKAPKKAKAVKKESAKGKK